METFFQTFSISANYHFERPFVWPKIRTTLNHVTFTWELKLTMDEIFTKPRINLALDEYRRSMMDAVCMFTLITKQAPDPCMQGTQFVALERDCMFWKFADDFEPNLRSRMKIFADGCFRFLLKICIPRRYFESEIHSLPIDRLVLPENTAKDLFDQVMRRVQADELSDIVLISSDNSKYYCHKFVLSACSDVFKTMFTGPMKCGKEIRIDDICSEAMTTILRYIYKGEIDENKMSMPLTEKCLYVAEKYNLSNLKSLCLSRLNFFLDQDNVLYILDLADKYSCESLSLNCIQVLRLFEDRLKCNSTVRQLLWYIQKIKPNY